MATRQAAVLAHRGATRILSSSSARAGSALASSSAESYFQVARRDGILGAERGLAIVVIMRRTAGVTELLIRPLSGPLPNPVLPKLANGMRGRFEVSEDYDFESFVLNGSPKESRRTEDREQSRREKENRELRKADDRVDRDSFRRVGSFGSERVLSSIRGLTMDTRELDRSSLQYPSAAISKKFPCIQISQFHATSSVDAVQEIGMPSLSPTMTQGNIAKWRKKEGEKVSAGDILCEIETDKATVDMESMEDGFLGKVLVGDGAKDIPCGQAICLMVESEDELKTIADYKPTGGGSAPAPKAPSPSPAAAAPPPSPPKESPKPASSKPFAPPPTRPTGDRVFASPAARKLAEDKNVSLSSIKGTGPEGSIVKADVEEYLGLRTVHQTHERFKITVALATGPSPSRSSTKQGVSAGRALAGDVDYRDIPNTPIRKITAKRLLQSKQTIPHYYLSLDTRVDKLLRLRADLNKNLEASQIKGGPVRKVSLNDFVIKAAALALKKVPEVNSSWTEEYIRQYNNVNIGIAVQTEHGLMVPVVKDADKKGLATISDDIKALAGKARSNTLKPNDYEGGTFTVSNLGSFGVKQFCAIVNPPQACILAVGKIEKRVFPGAESGEYEPGNVMTVTLSCDHRVIDGAVGAQWLGAFKGYIEDPVTLML